MSGGWRPNRYGLEDYSSQTTKIVELVSASLITLTGVSNLYGYISPESVNAVNTVIDYTRAMGLTTLLIQVSSAVSIGLAYLIHINEIPESRPSSVWKHYWRNTRQDIAVRAVSSMVIIDYSFNIINHLLRS